MAASHLSLTSSSNLEMLALSHRIAAIKGFNEALTRNPTTQADGDALLATCYALALQSSYMGTSISEFLTMLRGVNLLISQDWSSKYGSVFKALNRDSQVAIADERLCSVPSLNKKAAVTGRQSLIRLRNLCDDALSRNIWSFLYEVFEACETSSREGRSPLIIFVERS